MAEKWEYITDSIVYDVEHRVWTNADGNSFTTMAEPLNLLGAEGWELVSISPEFWSGANAGDQGANAYFDVYTFRAVFKRRLSSEEKHLEEHKSMEIERARVATNPDTVYSPSRA